MGLARKLEVEHLSNETLLFFQGSNVYDPPFFKVKLRGHLVTLWFTSLVKNVLNYPSFQLRLNDSSKRIISRAQFNLLYVMTNRFL